MWFFFSVKAQFLLLRRTVVHLSFNCKNWWLFADKLVSYIKTTGEWSNLLVVMEYGLKELVPDTGLTKGQHQCPVQDKYRAPKNTNKGFISILNGLKLLTDIERWPDASVSCWSGASVMRCVVALIAEVGDMQKKNVTTLWSIALTFWKVWPHGWKQHLIKRRPVVTSLQMLQTMLDGTRCPGDFSVINQHVNKTGSSRGLTCKHFCLVRHWSYPKKFHVLCITPLLKFLPHVWYLIIFWLQYLRYLKVLFTVIS